MSSVCSCESNWSTYDYSYTKRMNQLEAARAEKVVYVSSNLHFLRVHSKSDLEEQC